MSSYSAHSLEMMRWLSFRFFSSYDVTDFFNPTGGSLTLSLSLFQDFSCPHFIVAAAKLYRITTYSSKALVAC